MEGLNEMMRQPEGLAVVLAFLALLVTVMAALYGALERAALARRLAAIEAEMEDEVEGPLPFLRDRSATVSGEPENEESSDDSLPSGVRFV